MSFFGKPTIDELQDLVKTKDYTLAKLAESVAAGGPGWAKSDPTGYAAWTADYNAFLARYHAAHDRAMTAIHLAQTSFAPNNVIACEAEYNGILNALSPGGNSAAKGSLNDLVLRLGQHGITYNDDARPQPTASDWDLHIMHLPGVDSIGQGGNVALDWLDKKKKEVEDNEGKLGLLAVAGGCLALFVVVKALK